MPYYAKTGRSRPLIAWRYAYIPPTAVSALPKLGTKFKNIGWKQYTRQNKGGKKLDPRLVIIKSCNLVNWYPVSLKGTQVFFFGSFQACTQFGDGTKGLQGETRAQRQGVTLRITLILCKDGWGWIKFLIPACTVWFQNHQCISSHGLGSDRQSYQNHLIYAKATHVMKYFVSILFLASPIKTRILCWDSLLSVV
jgi:hypothetical protein